VLREIAMTAIGRAGAFSRGDTGPLFAPEVVRYIDTNASEILSYMMNRIFCVQLALLHPPIKGIPTMRKMRKALERTTEALPALAEQHGESWVSSVWEDYREITEGVVDPRPDERELVMVAGTLVCVSLVLCNPRVQFKRWEELNDLQANRFPR
jgi:hypothetical protein